MQTRSLEEEEVHDLNRGREIKTKKKKKKRLPTRPPKEGRVEWAHDLHGR
jgi:hypothetical protein